MSTVMFESESSPMNAKYSKEARMLPDIDLDSQMELKHINRTPVYDNQEGDSDCFYSKTLMDSITPKAVDMITKNKRSQKLIG